MTFEVSVDSSHVREVRQVIGVISHVLPPPFGTWKLQIVASNKRAASIIGLDHDEFNNPKFVEYFSGRAFPPGSLPYSHKYLYF